MLKSDAAKVLTAIEYDIGQWATLQVWSTLQHLADAAIRSRKKTEDGKWVPLTSEERLLNVRNTMLMDLTGRVDDDEEIWRVAVTEVGVSALYIGLGEKPKIEGKCLSDLPQWMQERVSVLSMLTERPPTSPVQGVGRRLSANVYWIVR